MARYEIIGANGSHVIEARGRDEWALIELAAAGPFPGNHARYILHGLLTRPEESNAA